MSLRFNDNNYCYVPYNAALDTLTNAISICTWAYITQSQNLQMFINRATGSAPGNEWWSLNLSGMAPRALIGNTTSVTNVIGATALQINTWYHLAFTFNGTNIILYQDGAVIGTGTRTMTFSADTSGIVVGANAQGANDTNIQEFTQGYLEDMRLYNRVLTPNEIATIMSSNSKDYINNGLLFKLSMDERPENVVASGALSVIDSGPLGLHATPNGSCLYGPNSHTTKRSPSLL